MDQSGAIKWIFGFLICGMTSPVLAQISKMTLITMHAVCMCLAAIQTHLEPTEMNGGDSYDALYQQVSVAFNVKYANTYFCKGLWVHSRWYSSTETGQFLFAFVTFKEIK